MSSRLRDTRWSLILAARTLYDTRRRLAITNLTDYYWKPVYCCFRRRGYPNEEAKDLTQEFFCEFTLDGKLLQAADREIGCFRQLLMTALKRFLSNVERGRNRKKRVPEGGLVPLPSTESGDIDPPSSEATAIYYAAIASALAHHEVRVTKLSYESLSRSFEELTGSEWLPTDLRQLFREAHTCCIRHMKQTGT